MAKAIEKIYKLRNHPGEVFTIRAQVTKENPTGDLGAEITATITHLDKRPFRYVVEFGGDFVKTKKNFTPEMFLHTAVSIVESQIESQKHEDTRLRVYKDSGLTETFPL
ncbi:MAG: hypothetical protein WC314_01305 [Vulcanimicrobiota bacterium]